MAPRTQEAARAQAAMAIRQVLHCAGGSGPIKATIPAKDPVYQRGQKSSPEVEPSSPSGMKIHTYFPGIPGFFPEIHFPRP